MAATTMRTPPARAAGCHRPDYSAGSSSPPCSAVAGAGSGCAAEQGAKAARRGNLRGSAMEASVSVHSREFAAAVDGLAWLASATAFAVSMSATPGPNNAMVTASGATWGFRRTLPHMLGISVGFPGMLLAVALGAGEVLRARPW